MIKNLIITNYLGESILIDLARPETSGFAVKSITGLGPPKADVSTTKVSTGDGSKYNSGRVNERNIVLKLEYYPTSTESIENIRQKSYKYFPLKKELLFCIETDNRICEAIGYVETNEPDIFSKKSGCQISIVCPDPYLYSLASNTTVFYGVESNFSFPFGNNSLTEKLIEMSIIQNKISNFVYYDGDSEVGLTIIIHAVGEATDISIYNTNTRESMKIDSAKLVALTGEGIHAGDEITINTNRGNKNITLLRDGVSINILNCLVRGSSWFNLSKGDNIFAYIAESGGTNLQFKILNRVIYEGI